MAPNLTAACGEEATRYYYAMTNVFLEASNQCTIDVAGSGLDVATTAEAEPEPEICEFVARCPGHLPDRRGITEFRPCHTVTLSVLL